MRLLRVATQTWDTTRSHRKVPRKNSKYEEPWSWLRFDLVEGKRVQLPPQIYYGRLLLHQEVGRSIFQRRIAYYYKCLRSFLHHILVLTLLHIALENHESWGSGGKETTSSATTSIEEESTAIILLTSKTEIFIKDWISKFAILLTCICFLFFNL